MRIKFESCDRCFAPIHRQDRRGECQRCDRRVLSTMTPHLMKQAEEMSKIIWKMYRSESKTKILLTRAC